jgi:hypothetical protein
MIIEAAEPEMRSSSEPMRRGQTALDGDVHERRHWMHDNARLRPI